MNKFMKLSAAAILLMGAAACSSDEPQVDVAGTEEAVPTSDVAYVAINIKDVNSGSRATEGDFEYGTADEYKVENAKFLFFDATGKFLLEANVWNGGNPGTKPNIEYIGNNVLVLENLLATGYPKSLITILNPPADLNPIVGETTLEDIKNFECDIKDAKGNFVMSTTSFLKVDQLDPERPVYFATPLTSANFKQEPYPSPLDATVTVYIERLAAKVRLSTTLTPVDLENGMTGYKVPTSIAGNPNDEGGKYEGVTDVYVTFEGWGLSNYEETSNLSKNLDKFSKGESPQFNSSDNNTYWNDPKNFRTYWAQSRQYGEAEPNLKRNDYNSLTTQIGKKNCLYLPETTNSYENIQNNKLLKSANVASVLVKSVIRNIKGEAIDVIQFQGINYLKKSFIAYGLQTLKAQNKLNYFTCVETPVEGAEPTKEYFGIEEDSIIVDAVPGGKTGQVQLVSKYDLKTPLYTKDTEGKYIPTGVKNLNEALGSFTLTSKAIAYTDGAQYYNIPIEHIAKENAEMKNVTFEGEYGVVRNHIYDITITKISNLGGGIYDPGYEDVPGEPIIPDDPKDTYYLSAKINILSWKIVSQNVEL